MLVLYRFWHYCMCSSRALAHPAENTVYWRAPGNEPPASYSSQASRQTKTYWPAPSSKHIAPAVFRRQRVFSPHLYLTLSAPMHWSPVWLSCFPCFCPSLRKVSAPTVPPYQEEATRKCHWAGKRGKTVPRTYSPLPSLPSPETGQGRTLLFWILRCLCCFLSNTRYGKN